jgi:16S rRNA (guanine966-N2)-methyltransferase
MDRVKAAIFSSLGERVVGARVLDLFAGSGALGIEALSRGADSATFVENDRQALDAIERNLAQAGLSGRIRRQDVFEFLRRASDSEIFDLIFADPPYDELSGDESIAHLLLKNENLGAHLARSGLLVLETRPQDISGRIGWDSVRTRRYGATEVLFLQYQHRT